MLSGATATMLKFVRHSAAAGAVQSSVKKQPKVMISVAMLILVIGTSCGARGLTLQGAALNEPR